MLSGVHSMLGAALLREVCRSINAGLCKRILRTKVCAATSAAGNTEKSAAMDYSNFEKYWPLAAVCQVNSKNDKAANFRNVQILLRKAKRTGAIMAFLPECFDYIGESVEESLHLAEPLDGPLIKSYCELARSMQMWLSLGGFHERVPEEKKCFNSHIVIDLDGNIVSVYRKIHLYDVDIPNRITLKESAFSRPGPCLNEPITTPLGCMGMQICYDLRFAEEALLLRRDGAQILTYPSAFTIETGMSHWEALLRARAIENQTYVIAAAQSGRHNARRVSFGHSMIVDPWGTIVAQCTDEMDVAVAEINLDRVEWIRSRMPVAQHRRYDLYGLSARCLTPSSQVCESADKGAVCKKQPCNDFASSDQVSRVGARGNEVAAARVTGPPEISSGSMTRNADASSPSPRVNGPAEISNGSMPHSEADDEGRGGSDADPMTTTPDGLDFVESSKILSASSSSSFTFGKVSLKPEHVFYATNLSFAFVNLKPVLPGHVLIAPRRQVERIHQLRPSELSDLFRVVQAVERVVHEHFHGTSSTVTVQDGPDAGQSIAHVHVHVMPRTKGDFKNNDDIYVEITRQARGGPTSASSYADESKNDSAASDERPSNAGVDADTNRQPRTDEEMTAEAAALRKVVEKLKGK